jgi:hypothetical protein
MWCGEARQTKQIVEAIAPPACRATTNDDWDDGMLLTF